MKFYLSSFKLGNQAHRLTEMVRAGTIGYIPNATDFSTADPERVSQHMKTDIKSLNNISLDVKIIDLKNFFGYSDNLYNQLKKLAGVWVSGGNVFVLRQAMKLSGLDEILIKNNFDENFVYDGYSAGCCVLSPSLKPYQIVDDATDLPYSEQAQTIWDGLGILDFAFMPHFNSDHLESSNISKEIEYCRSNNISYRCFSDGEVLIL